MSLDLRDKLVKFINKQDLTYWEFRHIHTNVQHSNLREKRLTNETDDYEGIGFRVLYKDACAQAFTNQLKINDLKQLIKNLEKQAKTLQKTNHTPINLNYDKTLKVKEKNAKTFTHKPDFKEREKQLQKFKKRLEKQDARLKLYTASITDVLETRHFENNEGTKINTIQQTTHPYASVKIKEKNKIDYARLSTRILNGSRNPLNFKKFQTELKEDIKIKLDTLNAKHIKAGKYNVILDPSMTATFAHEAIGHACEADYIKTKSSILSDKLSEQIAPEHVSISDNATLKLNGYRKYDDEGIKTREINLIKNGVLNEFMHNRETSNHFQVKPTGSSRCQNYSNTPIVRMSNTIVKPGNHSFEELLDEVKNGYLLKNFTGGQTNISSGNYQFGCNIAYEIKNKKLTRAFKPTNIRGDTLTTLHKITSLEKKQHESHSVCGKNSQKVPTGKLAPHALIKNVILGGK